MPLRFAIAAARAAAGLTQQELADAAGVGVMTISEAERGVAKRIDLVTLERIARALGVPAGSLIVDAADAPPKRPRGRPPKPRT